MGLFAKAKSAVNFERPAPGTYNAVCQSVHDIGIQKETYQGTERETHKIIIVWEIDETIKTGEYAGKRFVVSNRYTLSLYERSSLRATLVSWRGKDFKSEEEAENFDIEKIVGAPCMITITESIRGEKTYTNVNSVVKLPKGMQQLIAENPPNHKYEWIEKLKEKGGIEVIKETEIKTASKEEVNALCDSLEGSASAYDGAQASDLGEDEIPF